MSALLLTQRDTTFLHCRIIISWSIVQYRLLKRLHICCWDAEPVRMDLWPITGAAPRVNAFSPGPATVARSIPQDYGMQPDVSDWFAETVYQVAINFRDDSLCSNVIFILMVQLGNPVPHVTTDWLSWHVLEDDERYFPRRCIRRHFWTTLTYSGPICNQVTYPWKDIYLWTI